MAKVQNTSKWGLATAKERYGTARGDINDYPQANNLEAPQDIQNQRDEPKYSNIASGWVRGAVGKPTMKNETAENKPGFDKNSKTGKL